MQAHGEPENFPAVYSASTVNLNVSDWIECAHDARLFGLQSSFPGNSFRYKYVKRTFDIFAVLAISPVVIVVCACIAITLLVSSAGPVLFRHRRLRFGGHFNMWKFRTMCPDADAVLHRHLAAHPESRAEWEASHKLRDDPRANGFGSFLRRTSLDELPQLWNVLLGDMSLVGPRPIVVVEVQKYGSDYSFYTSVKPGVTGLWQVSGRSSLSYSARVALDRCYVENWSLGMEVAILVRTFRVLANTDSAY